MTALPGPATGEVHLILTEIRDAMVEMYGVSVDEAEGRIASVMGSLDLESEETELALGHEEPEYWAGFVYYGPEVAMRDFDVAAAQPRPWP